MDINIYYVLGGLAIIYLIFTVYNRKTAKRRKSRKFMEGYERKGKGEEKDEN